MPEGLADKKLLVLDLGADVNGVDDNGETAMHGAAYNVRINLPNMSWGREINKRKMS